MCAFSQAAWFFGAAIAGTVKAIARLKARSDVSVFMLFSFDTNLPNRRSQNAAKQNKGVLPSVAIGPICYSDCPRASKGWQFVSGAPCEGLDVLITRLGLS